MHPILADLKQDHVIIAKLVTVIEKQVELLETGENADLELLSEIADFFAHYPDAFHHPREDKLFAVFHEHHSGEEETFRRLAHEHHSLPGVTRRLQQELGGLTSGNTIMKVDDLVNQLRDFASKQKEHLILEEKNIFPLIDKELTQSEWRTLERTMGDEDDAWLSEDNRARYRSLYATLAL